MGVDILEVVVVVPVVDVFVFVSSRRRHTRLSCDWSSDVCSSDLTLFRSTRLSCDWSSDVCSSDHRKSTRLNSSHTIISYAVFCLKKKRQTSDLARIQSPHNRSI